MEENTKCERGTTVKSVIIKQIQEHEYFITVHRDKAKQNYKCNKIQRIDDNLVLTRYLKHEDGTFKTSQNGTKLGRVLTVINMQNSEDVQGTKYLT